MTQPMRTLPHTSHPYLARQRPTMSSFRIRTQIPHPSIPSTSPGSAAVDQYSNLVSAAGTARLSRLVLIRLRVDSPERRRSVYIESTRKLQLKVSEIRSAPSVLSPLIVAVAHEDAPVLRHEAAVFPQRPLGHVSAEANNFGLVETEHSRRRVECTLKANDGSLFMERTVKGVVFDTVYHDGAIAVVVAPCAIPIAEEVLGSQRFNFNAGRSGSV